MNKAIVLLSVVVFVLIILLGLTYLYSVKQENNVTVPNTSISSTTSTESVSRAVMSIGTRTGTVETKDFLHDPAVQPDPANQGYYFIGNHFSADAPPPSYAINYIASTNYFNIGLYAKPLGKNRKDAEDFLMQRLGLSESQMCDLKYMVSVPTDVDAEYSSRSLGFSFCPGSVELP